MKKALALLLVLAMVVGMLPMSVLAEENGEGILIEPMSSEEALVINEENGEGILVEPAGSEEARVINEEMVDTVSYTVEHHFADLSNSFDGQHEIIIETQNGSVGAQTAAAAQTREGFQAGEIAQTEIAADGTTVVTIYYTRNTYTVVFVNEEEEYSKLEDVLYGHTISAPADLNCTWVKADGNSWNFDTDMVTGDLTLTALAKNTAVEYAVTFDANAEDAEGSMDVMSVSAGTSLTLAANAFARPGYEFDGWVDADGNVYADQAEVTPDADLVLYAQWKEVVAIATTYTVSFNLNGGNGTIEPQTVVEGELAIMPDDPTYNGTKAFICWHDNDGNEYDFTTPVTSNITLTAQWECDYYNLIESSEYTLVPGATEYEYIYNDDAGNRRQVVHVIEVDGTNPNVSVMPSANNIAPNVDYTDPKNWGPLTVTEQAAHVENNLGKNVIGGMNVSLSWDFKHPYGLVMYEGVVLHDSRESCDTCGKGHPGGGYLVIKENGKAELRNAKDPIQEDDWMALTVCFNFLVRNGVNQHSKESHSGDDAPRSVIGVKADGTLVMMMVDGRMSPYSAGFTSHEMAEMMISLGCVDAINCDGGGSSTFMTEREGSGELTVKSRFSDGSERQTLTALLVLSNMAPTGEFDHAAIETSEKLVTPGSSVTFTAAGVDASGAPAEIPAGVTWKMADDSMGSVENGVFTSSGAVGTAIVQMVYEGGIVGEASVGVVIPDSISFDYPNMTAPYGKSINIDVSAKYGNSPVALKASDLIFTLENGTIGTIDGTTFTAVEIEPENTSSAIRVTLVHNQNLTADAMINLGRGSEIVYDFESGAESVANWSLGYKTPYTPENYFFEDTFEVVSAENGKVRNGNYALKISADGDSITCMNWCQTRFNGLNLDVTDAVSISFWMYIPEGSHGYEWDIGSAIPVVLGHEFKYGTGWQYFTVPINKIGSNITKVDRFTLYHSDTNNTADGYLHYERPNYYADVTYYIDDITINYSSAVEDCQAPVISNANISYEGVDAGVAMKGQTLATNTVGFIAKATDNYSGLDTSSVAVYVDGQAISASCSDMGIITTGDITLANGGHVVRFQISDKMGNQSTFLEHYFVLDGNSTQNTINYVPADPTLVDVAEDSLVWMNLEATAIEDVSNVTTVIDLDQNSKWELNHMELAEGFTATYSIDTENNDATIVIARTGNVTATGKSVLVSMPIRVWSPAFHQDGAASNEDASSYRLVSVMSHVEKGLLTETDGTSVRFGSLEQKTTTEWNSTRLTSVEQKTSYHIHTEEALADAEATCTKAGYTDRTFCAGCNSIIAWGTTVPETGHRYEAVNGKLMCECGDTLNKTGFVSMGDALYYAINGQLKTGWLAENEAYYYFDPVTYQAVDGEQKLDNGYTYTFENKVLVRGYVQYLSDGMRYNWAGKWAINQWHEIDGKTYFFKQNGRAACGTQAIKIGANAPIWYRFDDEGVFIEKISVTGLFQHEGATYYLVDGEARLGLILAEDGYFYYFSSSSYAAVTTRYYVTTYNEYPQYVGYQNFDAQGRMEVIQPEEPDPTPNPDAKNGIYTEDGVMYYYKDGAKYYAGLIMIDGDYYYVNSSCKVVTGTYYVSKHNGLTEYVGSQKFGADGKMIIEGSEPAPDPEQPDPTPDPEQPDPTPDPDAKNGIYTEDGVMYYYKDGAKYYAGLIMIDGDYYYVNSSCKVVTGTYYVSKHNGLTEYVGSQKFGADGKMIIEGSEPAPDPEQPDPTPDPDAKNGIYTEDGVMYYYKDGAKYYAGLIMIDGDYYYVNSSCKVVTGTYYVSKHNGLTEYVGSQTFDVSGKMIIEGTEPAPDPEQPDPTPDPDAKNGIYTENGTMYYYQDGAKYYAGLIMIDGDYYYVNSSCIVVTGKYYVSKHNGLKQYVGSQIFGADGKMVIG